MERKRRTLLAVLIATIIVLAVFASFAITLFGQENYQIKLPDLTDDTQVDSTNEPGSSGGSFIRIEVTPQTVQNVIATLNRPRSYYRELNMELWADAETSAVTTVQVWVDGGWTRTSVTAPGGLIQHNLLDGQQRWLWYEGDETARTFPVDGISADLVQRIPTYEDVLNLPQERITAAGYETYVGADCVYVEVEQTELNSRERYWVSVSDGLLMGAERVKDDLVVYRMTAQSTVSPTPLDSSFVLPDGTVLHIAGEEES